MIYQLKRKSSIIKLRYTYKKQYYMHCIKQIGYKFVLSISINIISFSTVWNKTTILFLKNLISVFIAFNFFIRFFNFI